MNETTLNGRTPDIAEENIAKLREIFPDVFSEKKVDFDKLRQVLGEYIEDADERYNFTWNGKSKALHLAQTPSTGTLRPCKEESKDWDTTQNLYIEGDNLEVLKLLQKSYHGKIKMIYIDPPYNTGGEFVYKDDFRDNIQNYLEVTGQVDGEGRKLGTNSESSGRFHTDWLNMMYPRLRLARNLLSDDGVIFISIDDNEVTNLHKLCDEVFGENNFIATLIWQSTAGSNTGTEIVTVTENILVYTKKRNVFSFDGMIAADSSYTLSDEYEIERGKYALDKLDRRRVGGHYSEALNYGIEMPDGTIRYPGGGSQPSSEGWNYLWSKTKVEWGIENGFIVFKKTNGEWNVYNKRYAKIDNEGNTIERTIPFRNLITSDQSNTAQGTAELRMLFDLRPFDFPKPSGLIKNLLLTSVRKNKNATILDFFSGSATTAHAVMQLNAEDGGNRRFICVQLPEATDEKSEAYKAGYKNICEIGKERIRRAGEKIINNEELRMNNEKLRVNNEKGKQLEIGDGTDGSDNSSLSIIHSTLDTGFKVFKLDSSNIKKWNPDYDDIQQTLYDMVDNIVDGRTEADLAYEIMLKYGLDLSYPVDELDCGGKKIYSVGFGMLMICMADDVTTDVAKFIADYKKENEIDEMRVVFKDTCFKDDSTKTNIKEILKCAGVEEFVTV